MSREPLFSQLPAPRQDLVRLCQSTNYGEVINVAVRDREPILYDPQCIVLVDVKLDSEQRSRQQSDQSDFVLSAEVVRLMVLLDMIQNGIISKLEVRAGIPRRVIWERRTEEFRVVST
jgi:hypothetical protein